jgi:hypothetical protein
MVNIMANYINPHWMRIPMRFLCAALSFLLMIPAALGSIDITLNSDYFNIGDSVEISSSVSAERTMSAYMRFTAVCGSFSLQYFTTPIDVKEGYRTQIDAPKLKVSSAMQGQCLIKAELLDGNGGVSDEGMSKSFSVSDGLEIVLATEDLSTLPGVSKKIEGVVRGAGGQTVNADIMFTFDEEEYAISTFNGKFIAVLDISPTAKTGKHSMTIVAVDNEQNKGSATGEIDVIAVPSRLELSLQPASQNPGMEISYKATITDQAGELIDDSVGITIVQPDGVFMYKGDAKSGVDSTYTLGQYANAGEHKVAISYRNLGSEAVFTINEIRDVALSQQGETVLVENIGNVAYEDEISIVVEGDGQSYIVKENVELDPGEMGTIDLSKEVPYGHYTILVPQLTAQLLEENATQEEEMVLAEDVEIHDGRSAFKKTSSGLKGITGNIVGSDGVITRNGWTAPVLLVSVIVIIGLYYTRDIWLLMLMRRR